MDIVKARVTDLEIIEDIYTSARTFMANSGNERQWGCSYPSREIILSDIKRGELYLFKDNDEIVGCFVFTLEKEECYEKIDGSFSYALDYGTIHRIAKKKSAKGILISAIEYALSHINYIRIDTHKDNLIMQERLIKYGFKECGIVIVDDNTPRLAYDYLNRD